MFEKIRRWYKWNIWTASMVKEAVSIYITQEECDKILSEK